MSSITYPEVAHPEFMHPQMVSPTNPVTVDLQQELRTLIADLGKDGGIISPSVYDTAQVLRFYPPEEGVEPALAWLLGEQRADGGWGDPFVPLARDMPTLAAVLALHELGRTREADEAVDAGLQFLATRTDEWNCGHIDLMPIAAEMIIPWLLEDALCAGLRIDQAPYTRLCELRRHKKSKLSSVKIEAGSGPTYSFEALDMPPDSALVDVYGSVGHSPSATARWLQLAERTERHTDNIGQARQYLRQAADATGERIPGVVPTVWPLPVFEYIYSLHAFFQNDFIIDEDVAELIRPILGKIDDLLKQTHGLSFSEHFIPDVDCTSVGTIVVAQGGKTVDPGCILQFRHREHFFTFAAELNPSVFSNAHALSALAYSGFRQKPTEDFLLDRQLANGAWMPDKWHSSWLYTTLEMIDLLLKLDSIDAAMRAKNVILLAQHDDGHWGDRERANCLDTTYAVTALQQFQRNGLLAENERPALHNGRAWLLENYRPEFTKSERLWLGKELYSPCRVDQAYVLAAMGDRRFEY